MSLSTEELQQAQTAMREVTIVQQRKRMWVAFGLFFLSMFLQAVVHHHWLWFKWVPLVLVIGMGSYCWRNDRRAAKRYPGNIDLLRSLTEREPDLTRQLGDPFAYRPLLHAWNQRRGQRALLWRLDQFLSGKGW